MKSNILCSIAKCLLIAGILSGCTKDDPKPDPKPKPGGNETLTVSTTSFTVNSKGVKSTFTITASGAWSISGGDAWCIVSPSSGSGNATVHIEVLENTSANTRTTKIDVTSGSLKREIAVTQSEKSTILLTGKSLNIDCNGGVAKAEVQTNIDFDLIIPSNVTWITHISTKALQTKVIEFNISKNTQTQVRSAEIILREKSGTLSDTLTVNQEDFYYINSPYSSLFLQKVSSSVTIKMDSSVDLDFQLEQGINWITLERYNSPGREFVFRIDRNPGDNSRKGKIKFIRKGGGTLADSLEIRQSGFDGYHLILENGKTLAESVPKELAPSIINLKIEGELFDDDFLTIRNYYRHLEVIDLSEAALPENSLPAGSFAGDEIIYTKLNSVLLPDNLVSIGEMAFSGCVLLKVINLPDGVKNIGKAAFTRCIGLTGSLSLPKSLENIGVNAFLQCENIESITLPKGLKSIGFGAFHNCNLLKVISSMESPFPLGNSFSRQGRTILIVPKGFKQIYSSVSGWNNTAIFSKIVESGDSFEDYIKVDKKNISFTASASNESIVIQSSASWKIENKPSWVTLTKTSGQSGETVGISVSAFSGSNFREGKIEISLYDNSAIAEVLVYQHSLSFNDGSYVKLQSATKGKGIDLIFMGDGYTTADIAAGKYVADLSAAASHYFDIEPYRSYREYFNIYLVYAFSQESGITFSDKKVATKFDTKFLEEDGTLMSTNFAECYKYAEKVPLVNSALKKVILIANSNRYAGTCYMNSNGCSVSICPLSPLSYPFDFRGVVQHEACGHGFALLADEYVKYPGMVPEASVENLRSMQGYKMFLNVDATNDRSQVLWKHFFSDPLYSYVGTFEGGYYYPQGIWRPEEGSLMINNIRYINAPSREIIVRYIKELAGEPFSFSDFRARDKSEISAATKAKLLITDPKMYLHPPVVIIR